MTRSSVFVSGDTARRYLVPALVFFASFVIGGWVLLAGGNDWNDASASQVTQVTTVASPAPSAGPAFTSQTTTVSPGPPDLLDRLISARAATLIQLGAIGVAAFILAALVQRVLFGEYAFKLAGAELSRIPDQAVIARATEGVNLEVRRSTHLLTGFTARDLAGPTDSREPAEASSTTPVAIRDVRDLAGQLASEVANLLDPPSPSGPQTPEAQVSLLIGRGILGQALAQDILKIIDLGQGPRRPSRRLDESARSDGPALISRLRALQSTAASVFEEHVLKHLVTAPQQLQICVNAVVADAMRVDARVQRRDAAVFVEVRARLAPGREDALAEIRAYLGQLRTYEQHQTPLVLVVPGAVPSSAEQGQLREVCPRLRVISWDANGTGLIEYIRSALDA